MLPASVSLCKTDVPGDGCGAAFPQKTQIGLCPKCLHLKTLDDNGDVREYQRFANLPACIGCGVAFQHLSSGQLCGTCNSIKAASVDLQSLVQEKQAERLNAREARMQNLGGRSSIGQASQRSQRAVSSNLNTLSVSAAKQSLSALNHPQESTITVCMVYRVGKSIAAKHGFSVQSHSEHKLLIDVQQSTVNHLNQTSWCTNHAEPLMCEDTHLRWHQNIPLDCDDKVTKLSELYHLYHEHSQASSFYGNLPKAFQKVKGKYVVLELLIDNDLYEERIAANLSDADEPPKYGRKRSRKSKETGSHASIKRSRTGPLESTFVYNPQSLSKPKPRDEIRLIISKISIIDQTGEFTIDWSNTEEVTAFIEQTPFAHGKSKRAFNLEYNNQSFAAKRFFDIGKGADIITVEENAQEVEAEFRRLMWGQWFWKRFVEHAAQNSTRIAKDVVFVDALLVKEVLRENDTPSEACGFTGEEIKDSPVKATYWLLEPRRTDVVTKYSHTLNHPNHRSQKGQTIAAFTHFAWVYSKKVFVFADLQGAPYRTPSGNTIEVLFDPMIHSSLQNMGLGDHGEIGINAFLQQHRCSTFCSQMRLPEIKLMEGDDEEEQDSEEDNDDNTE